MQVALPPPHLTQALTLTCSAAHYFGLLSLFEEAISNLAGLHQVRHGTNLLNAVQIAFGTGLNVADAKGALGEETYKQQTESGYQSEPSRYIYLQRDTPSNPCACVSRWRYCDSYWWAKRIEVKGYAYQSSYALWKKVAPALLQPFASIGGALGYLTPTLKCHLSPQEIERFERDPWLPCTAIRTTKLIPAYRFGLTGSCFGLFAQRAMCDWDPKRRLFGAFQLAAAVSLTFGPPRSLLPNWISSFSFHVAMYPLLLLAAT